MKKIILLFVVLFITTSIFAQPFLRDNSFIETTCYGRSTQKTILSNNIVTNNFDWIRYVHFVKDERLYLLSYEPDIRFTGLTRTPAGSSRNIYLYSKYYKDIDSPWEQASGVVMTSNWMNAMNNSDVDFFDSKDSYGSVGKVVMNDDCIIITISWRLLTNGGVSACAPISFKFTPIGDYKYRVEECQE